MKFSFKASVIMIAATYLARRTYMELPPFQLAAIITLCMEKDYAPLTGAK